MPPSPGQDGDLDSIPQALFLAAMPNIFTHGSHQTGLKSMSLHLEATVSSFKDFSKS